MRRGTRVANAYVALTADGSGLNKDIVDSVDEAGDDIEKSGDEHGERYGDSFSEGFVSRMKGRLSGRLGNMFDGAGEKAGDEVGDSFVDRLSQKLREQGGRIGSELSDRMASNPEQVRRGIDRAFDDDFADRIGDRLGSRIVSGMAESIDRQSDRLGAAISEALDGAVSGNRGGRGGKSGGMSDMIGRMLGAGSRNNVLNFFGKTMGNVVGLVEKGAGFAASFAANMNKAGEGAGVLARVMAGFGGGGGLAKLAASAPMALVAIGVVTVAMSALVSVASALLGVVVALASTIASALVGALAVAAGAFAALSVAAGLATIAFTSMTNAQIKTLKSAFEPLHQAAAGLGQIMIQQMVPAFAAWSLNLQRALALAAPLAQVMGGAFARAGTIITAAFTGPGVQMFLNALTTTLPGIITNLSTAFSGFFNGVSAIFAALMPYVLRFSEYLSRVATDFARWATSARGQNAIVNFVDRALVSLASLWDFIKAVGGLLSTVLFNPKGQRVGNSIFESMADGVRRFTDYISKENRLEDWFARARKMAKTLGKAIEGIGALIVWLDNSKAVDVLWDMAKALETAAGWADKLGDGIEWVEEHLGNVMPPGLNFLDIMQDTATAAGLTGAEIRNWQVPGTLTSQLTALSNTFANMNGFIGPVIDPSLPDKGATPGKNGSALADLINSGTTALANTYEMYGGHMPDPEDPDKGPKFTQFEGGPVDDEWLNPFRDIAKSMAQEIERIIVDIRTAAREGREALASAMRDALKGFATLVTEVNSGAVETINTALASTDVGGLQATIGAWIESVTASTNAAIEQSNSAASSMVTNARATRDQLIASAQSVIDAARQRVYSATTKKEYEAALKDLQKAEKAMAVAQQKGQDLVNSAMQAADDLVANSTAATAKIESAKAIMAGQAVYTYENALNLARGLKVESATLADYAEARRWAAERLAEANTALASAISMRDTYASTVADSIRSFGSLMSAQAKTLNGVQQALTATDITDSLQERLNKARTFQENLRQLLALGLSDAAYKQIVDAGVEQGGAFATALLAGGQGSISEVNSLTAQFDTLATELGTAAGSQMYQAGVDAAQGLVDGLLSLSEQLEAAATELGITIANAVKRELGIASPSKVMYGMMFDNVGDGMVNGLTDAQAKVGIAAAALAGQVAVSPEVAAYAAGQGTSPTEVSGNQPGFRDLHVHTPTDDPYAVGHEVLNEITGRLP